MRYSTASCFQSLHGKTDRQLTGFTADDVHWNRIHFSGRGGTSSVYSSSSSSSNSCRKAVIKAACSATYTRTLYGIAMSRVICRRKRCSRSLCSIAPGTTEHITAIEFARRGFRACCLEPSSCNGARKTFTRQFLTLNIHLYSPLLVDNENVQKWK